MKQVINGHEYNTAAATLVAKRVQRVEMNGVSVGGVVCEEADIVHEFYVTGLGETFCFEMWNVLTDDPNRGGRIRPPIGISFKTRASSKYKTSN